MPQTERFCLNPYMNEECFLSKTLYVATFFSYVPFSYARIAFLSSGAERFLSKSLYERERDLG